MINKSSKNYTTIMELMKIVGGPVIDTDAQWEVLSEYIEATAKSKAAVILHQHANDIMGIYK